MEKELKELRERLYARRQQTAGVMRLAPEGLDTGKDRGWRALVESMLIELDRTVLVLDGILLSQPPPRAWCSGCGRALEPQQEPASEPCGACS